MNDNASTRSDEVLLNAVSRQVTSGGSYLLAYSGGLDSTVLLHLCVRLREQYGFSLRAAYVHHGLSAFADSWAQHCAGQCSDWHVPFSVLPVQVDAQQGGIEAAAREARYQAIRKHLHMNEVLLTAQHLNDQSETFLLALKRGSGPAGLSAMASATQFGEQTHLRPLLAFSRAQLAEYAAHHDLSWIEDDSNNDDRFDRNFLRRQVLPVLTQRWPHFPAAVSRSAELCAEQEQLLDELLAESLQSLRRADGGLSITALESYGPLRRAALLRRWLAAEGVRMPSREQLQRLWQDVALSRRDAEPQLVLGPWQIRRFRDGLYVLPQWTSVRDTVLTWEPASAPLALPSELGTLALGPQGVAVRRPYPDEAVTVRFHAQGKFHIVGRDHGRQLKKLWQESGVAPWMRERTPLIFYGERLIAAMGTFVTREGRPESENAAWRIVWHPASLPSMRNF
ncbi:tRNA lysidine(34) synthetase TilS [Lonsdalea populi]|uniref:tRNA lysidine(34) synthetase TilS n=1 Tax=Lonsdalea populi TaxID=1172565 RepID=UPI000A22B594|nr:tRNA lysidine(34) synthetase TilS [Lonsdalea populi]OSN00005.1 tRNA(Ile)-lysidine synthetase [Lonsdalea populi]RAT42837.1 tRNA(Ile)-lysidine synthetase [Lonsdalea populi]RAT43454.1 tRNA(Ile)-lysidine synthetase [Lonsdalea populi]RAT56871.1 tRNA(Ile)-lysidine synthetase [Lonsdalea populi]RAT61132.1 tRNA(Ile)-lysidine synthetase [Lonsdalea populi]